MTAPCATLRDNFEDNAQAAVWGSSFVTGSATKAETGGQARFTLPSSTAGSHQAAYQSSSYFDLTGDGITINVDTMVSTSVAATAALTIFDSNDVTSWIRIAQLSGNLNFQKNIGGSTTTIGTAVTWNASTHKYWRIRESAGTIYLDTSSTSTSWTNRGSVTTALSFVPTAIIIRMDAVCGNVASPGSFRVEEFNSIYPALTTNWRWQQQRWSLAHRFKVVTLAIDTAATVQGCVVTADGVDVNGDPSGNVRYWSGPARDGRELTEQASLAAAQAQAVNYPLDGRFDLPTLIEARVIRTYNRSIDGNAYTLREDYARRLIQADDLEAEIIRGMTILGHQLIVDNLSALTANIGQLTITTASGAPAWIYQGSGTGDSPTTGLKIFNSGGIGKLSTYNATVEQITLDTDGKLKAGAGVIQLDSGGLKVIVPTDDNYLSNGSLKFESAGGTVYADIYALDFSSSPFDNQLRLTSNAIASQPSGVYTLAIAPTTYQATVQLAANSGGFSTTVFQVIADDNARNYATLSRDLDLALGLNVGTASGAGTGQIVTSGNVGMGIAPNSAYRLEIKSAGTTSATYAIVAINSASTNTFYLRDDSAGYLNTTAWTYASDASKKRNIRGLGKDIVHFMQLEPRMFDYIDGPANRWGYLAQDVQALIPDLVETVADGTLGMRTDELLPLFNHVLRRLIRILIQKGVLVPADIA